MKLCNFLTFLIICLGCIASAALANEDLSKLKKLSDLVDRFAASQALQETCSDEKKVSAAFAKNFAYAEGLLRKELALKMPDRTPEKIEEMSRERAMLSIEPYKQVIQEHGCGVAQDSSVARFYELNNNTDPKIKQLLDSIK